ISILPNLWALVTHPAAFTWKGFDHLALGLLHIILPSFLLNSAYVVPAIIFLVAAVIAFFVARRDKNREDRALASQRARDAADQREAARAAQQEEIKRVIERQLGQRWYGGSSVVDALPDQAVEAQPDDLSLLPPPTATLRGREADIQWLLDRLYPKPARVIALYGKSGMGKSSVVAAALAQARDRFPDGIAVIDCSSSERAVELLIVTLARFAPVGVASAEETDLPNVAKRVLRGNRVLIVLDNVPTTLQGLDRLVEPLRDANLTVLAIARDQLDDHVFPIGAFRELRPLSPKDARTTLMEAAGSQANPQTVAAFAALLDNNPLALMFIGKYARVTGRPLEEIASELAAHSGRTANQPGVVSVASVVAYLYDRLPRPAQRFYVTLGAHPTMTLSKEVAIEVARQTAPTEKDAQATLDTLVNWGLLTVGEQEHVGLNIYTPTPVREDALSRFRTRSEAAQERAIARLERLTMRLKTYQSDVVQSPNQQAYLHMIRRARTEGARKESGAVKRLVAVERLVTLCAAAADSWRDKNQREALLVYLPIGLRAVDRGRASRWPWVWLWYRLPHMRLRYYDMLYYYADALCDVGKTQYSRVVFQRSLRMTRFLRKRIQKTGDVFGGLAKVAQSEAQQFSKDRIAREVSLKQARDYFQQVIDVLTPLTSNTKDVVPARDIANAYDGLARNALMADNPSQAEEFYQKGLDAIPQAAREGSGPFDDTLALLYSDQGDLALQRNEAESAAQWYQKALNHISVSDNPALWTEVTSNLAVADVQSGNTPEAATRLRESVAYWERQHDVLRAGLAHYSLGKFLLNHDDYDDAKVSLQIAGERLAHTTDRAMAAMASMDLGVTLFALGEIIDAEKAYRQSLIMFRESTNRWGTSAAFLQLGEISMQRGAMNDAEDLFTEARHIAIDSGDRKIEAYNLIDLGRVAQRRTQLDLARGYYQEAHDIFQGFDMPQEIVMALLAMADLARLRDEIPSAIRYLKQAEPMAGELRLESPLAEAKRIRGEIAYMRGRITLAERYFSAARDDYQRQQNQLGESAAVIFLGILALHRGDASTAQRDLAQVTAEFGAMKYLFGESLGLFYQGRAALAIDRPLEPHGDPATAAHARNANIDRLFNTARENFGAIGDLAAQGMAQTWRGRLAFMRGLFDDAEDCLEDGRKLADDGRDQLGQVMALVFQAELAQARGMTSAADVARRALELATVARYPYGEGLAQSALASILTDMGDLDGAGAAIVVALERLAQTEARPAHALALSRQARILAARGDAAGARAAYDAALVEARSVEDAYALARVTRDAG
ncbi:MAG TPA: NB-ARC domain-containing protein, partial [Ktedonobacterales bacterium]